MRRKHAHPAPQAHIRAKIVPQLPLPLRCAVDAALAKDRLRRMPNSILPAVQQGTAATPAGILLLGDAWNMRHPLTGGGMTVALNDVVLLRTLFGALPDFKDCAQTARAIRTWHWRRKPVAATVNILSVALYDLFAGDDTDLAVLRTGCLGYLERGGACVSGPAALLSVVVPSPLLLAWHFFAVALYSIWLLFALPYATPGLRGKPREIAPSFDEYPRLFRRSVQVLNTACRVFLPLVYAELRWWAPAPPPKPPAEPTFEMPVTLTVYIVWFVVPLVLWTLLLLYT